MPRSQAGRVPGINGIPRRVGRLPFNLPYDAVYFAGGAHIVKRPLACRVSLACLAVVAATLSGCFGRSEERAFLNNVLPPQGPPDSTVVQRPFEPAPLTVRVLLSWQYRNAVRDLLGAAAAALVTPPPDTTVNGLDAIGAAQLALSQTAITLYEQSALRAARAAMSDAATRSQLVGCAPQSNADQACLSQFVGRFGRRAWRRALADEERAAYVALGEQAATAYSDFYQGAAFAAAGLLQSPNFIYQVEVGRPDPDDASRFKLAGYEIATRLAFFLTGTTPKDELLAAAEAGELDTADGIRARAAALVNDSGAQEATSRFFDEMLQLRDLSQMAKDPAIYPMYSAALAAAMREETQRLLQNVIWDQDGDFRQVFDADYTFVNADLASLYGLSNPPPSGFARASLPADGRRGGILGQAAFLSLMAHPNSSSPTFRGKFVREKFLCQTIPAPPPDVDTNLPNTTGMTTREKLLAHRQNPSCAGCHALMDDIGLGLENFDGLGRYRTTEFGLPIDASASLDSLGNFAGARELGGLLGRDQRVTQCFARNLFRAATGHVDTEGESTPMDKIHGGFAGSGYRVKQLLVEIAASDAFRFAAKGVTP